MMLRAVELFELTLGDSTVTMAHRNRPPLTLYTNGKKWKQEIEPVGEIEFKAEWKGDYLQVERKLRSGMKAKVRYRHFPDTDHVVLYPCCQLENVRLGLQPRVEVFLHLSPQPTVKFVTNDKQGPLFRT